MIVNPKEKIDEILHSDASNYLETSERLVLKNILEKDTISELDGDNLDKIFQKYKKFIKSQNLMIFSQISLVAFLVQDSL